MTVNVADLLRDAVARDRDAVALVEHRPGRREVTWGQLDDAADAVARALSARGLVAGHRVALVMANCVDLPIAYFGVLRGGMVAVPINPRSTPHEIGRMLADAGVRVVLADDRSIRQVREAVDGLSGTRPAVVVDGAEPRDGETAFASFLAEAGGTTPAAPPDAERLAVVLYTSGSSGRPRGAMLTHRALIANIEQIAALDPPPVGPDDVSLGLLPLFHVYGLNAVLGQAVRQGSTVVLVDGFDPDALLQLVQDEGVTNLPLAPPVIAAWAGRTDLRERLASVRTVLSGASSLDPELSEAFTESSGLIVDQGYGLTEAAPVVALTLAAPETERTPKPQSPRGAAKPHSPHGAAKPHSVGRPLPGVEVRVVGATGESSGEDPGQLLIRGDNLFSGYWPDGAEGPDADGWYATGDIGLLDADGDLTLVDRLRELVIVSGFNVYPSEVEDVIADVQGVGQVAVVGLPHAETGEAVVAFVEPIDHDADESVLIEAVEAACRTRLARYKQPSRVSVIAGLPRSAVGKVEKGRLRAHARSEVLGLDGQP